MWTTVLFGSHCCVPPTSDRFRENVQVERDCAHDSLYIGTGIEKQWPCSLETLKLTEAGWSDISCIAPEHTCCSPCSDLVPGRPLCISLSDWSFEQDGITLWILFKHAPPCFAIAVLVRSLFWLQKQFIPDESMIVLAHCTFWWQAVSTS